MRRIYGVGGGAVARVGVIREGQEGSAEEGCSRRRPSPSLFPLFSPQGQLLVERGGCRAGQGLAAGGGSGPALRCWGPIQLFLLLQALGPAGAWHPRS